MTKKNAKAAPQTDTPTPPEPVRITPDENKAAEPLGEVALEHRLADLPDGTREAVAYAKYGAGWDRGPFRRAWFKARGLGLTKSEPKGE